jgi:hypothetical protein
MFSIGAIGGLLDLTGPDYTWLPLGASMICGSGKPRVQLRFVVASGVSRIIFLRRALAKLRKIREFEPTHVGCYVFVARTPSSASSHRLVSGLGCIARPAESHSAIQQNAILRYK